MEHNDSENGRGWREAVWSVPGPFILLYFALVTALGLPTLTVIIWEKAQAVSANWWLWHTAVIRAAAPECGMAGIGIAIYALLAVQGVAFLMVLYQFAVNKWVKPVIQRHKDAGRAEANRAWQAWLERKAAAESKGLPFDEPPPGEQND